MVSMFDQIGSKSCGYNRVPLKKNQTNVLHICNIEGVNLFLKIESKLILNYGNG